MDDESRQRLAAFVKALDAVGHLTGPRAAACHHSAVEVNDWQAIQQAMKDAGNGIAIGQGDSTPLKGNLPLTSAAETKGTPHQEDRP